mmetsp:Transcript_7794/g.24819  ORF Transcript_7794/g.24819 Transcript_7794/m.24819 type:complete len:231 (-) Transcript_7794:445-1137(-)
MLDHGLEDHRTGDHRGVRGPARNARAAGERADHRPRHAGAAGAVRGVGRDDQLLRHRPQPRVLGQRRLQGASLPAQPLQRHLQRISGGHRLQAQLRVRLRKRGERPPLCPGGRRHCRADAPEPPPRRFGPHPARPARRADLLPGRQLGDSRQVHTCVGWLRGGLLLERRGLQRGASADQRLLGDALRLPAPRALRGGLARNLRGAGASCGDYVVAFASGALAEGLCESLA